ncbi:MAG TPA: 30S ribosomal protein S6 [Solirubrobacteraceae bacterium]
MTLPAPTFDLVLVLDPQAEDSVRAKIVADSRAAIEAGGELLRHDEWGERALAYPIERHANGEYHLLQFHRASAELLEGLDRTLRITDGILRFRIIKLKPGVPDAPDVPGSAPAAPVAVTAAPAAPAEEQPAETPAAEAPAAAAPAPEQAPAEQPADELAVGEPA